MHSREKRRRFIRLRGQGQSYRKIAEKLNVAESTLIRWSRRLAVNIHNSEMMELETLQKEYLVTREHRIKVLATQLNNVADELLKSDLSNVSPQKLLEMQTQLTKELKDECPKMEFSRKIPLGGSEDVNRIMNKTDSWQA